MADLDFIMTIGDDEDVPVLDMEIEDDEESSLEVSPSLPASKSSSSSMTKKQQQQKSKLLQKNNKNKQVGFIIILN